MPKEENITTKEKQVVIPFPGDLRDYFAGQALAGLMADSRVVGEWELFARSAYEIADALIAEREK